MNDLTALGCPLDMHPKGVEESHSPASIDPPVAGQSSSTPNLPLSTVTASADSKDLQHRHDLNRTTEPMTPTESDLNTRLEAELVRRQQAETELIERLQYERHLAECTRALISHALKSFRRSNRLVGRSPKPRRTRDLKFGELIKDRSLHRGPSQNRSAKVGPSQIGLSQIRFRQIGLPKIGSG